MSDNSKLHSILEQGETVMWSGVPQPYSLFGESYKKSTIRTLCWALVWGVVLLGGYYALAVTKDVAIQKSILLFCAAVPVFIIGMAITDKNKVQKLVYAVTDKRAIVLSDKPISMRIADIDDIRVDDADDGNCHIRVGSPAFKASAKKLPVLAYRGESSDQDNTVYKGLAFFNVSAEDQKTIRALLKPAAAPAQA